MPIDDISAISPAALSGVQIAKGGMNTANMITFEGLNMYGQNQAYGIIFLTRNKTNQKLHKPDDSWKIINHTILGYPKPKSFYAPIYAEQNKLPVRDSRKTLYWNPNIIIEEEGKAAFDFYTSDETGKYQVTVEGVGVNGQLFHKIIYFDVK